MNFKKLMVVVVLVVVAITAYKFFTRLDRTNPVAVASGFTKALKQKDTASASKFVAPEQAEAWRKEMDEKIDSMRSGALDMFFERIPDAPAFGDPVIVAGKSSIASADKTYTLELTQIDGKWYVTKSPM